MDECGGERPGEQTSTSAAGGDRRCHDDADREHEPERCVDRDEPPRVQEEVAAREPERLAASSSLHPRRDDAGDEVALEDEEDDQDRQDRDDAPGRELGPLGLVGQRELRQPELNRVVGRVALAEEDQRPEEVVPRALELQDRDRGERRAARAGASRARTS